MKMHFHVLKAQSSFRNSSIAVLEWFPPSYRLTFTFYFLWQVQYGKTFHLFNLTFLNICWCVYKASKIFSWHLHKALKNTPPPDLFCSRLFILLHNRGEELLSPFPSPAQGWELYKFMLVWLKMLYVTILQRALETGNYCGGAEMLHDSFSFGDAVLNSAQNYQ